MSRTEGFAPSEVCSIDNRFSTLESIVSRSQVLESNLLFINPSVPDWAITNYRQLTGNPPPSLADSAAGMPPTSQSAE